MRDRLVKLAVRPHLPRRTVRLRLTLMYGCLFLVVGAGLLGFTYVLVRNATDGTYLYTGRGISAVVSSANGSGRTTEGASSVARQNQADSTPANGRSRDLNVAVIHGSGALTQRQMEAQARRLETLARQQHEAELRQLETQSGIALAVMTLVSLALGWFVAGRVLRPLRTITATARTISATNLHERLALEGPDDELKELGDTFDDLLGRLEGSFEAQRAFVANASHELRTPLARQQAVVQVALADPDATVDSLRAAHERVLAAGRQQERLIEALLTLTRGQAGLVRLEPFDLSSITAGVVRTHRVEADLREILIETNLEPAATAGNRGLVERLVVNLIDNALRHNAPHGVVSITTHSRDGSAVLSVRNDGPVVPAAELGRIFLPLQRLDGNRTSTPDGLGLGLSIVQAIASAHHATLTTRARPSGGLEVEVAFPAREQPPDELATSQSEPVPVPERRRPPPP